MIYDILEQKLVNAGLGVIGVSLFRGDMPATVTRGMMFRMPLSGVRIDPYLPGYHKPVLQLIVRHVDPVIGDLLAANCEKALTIKGAESFGATAEHGAGELKIFYARELPIRFPRLPGNILEWSINFVTAFSFAPLA